MTILSDFTEAKAGDWIAETFQRPTVSGGVGVFQLTGTSTGYTTFGDHFSDGDIVFYAAFDDDCNRECGFAKYSNSGQYPTLTPIESNATLANGKFVDGDVKPIAFPNGGTITGTFNSEAFNTIWNHLWDKENPHEVQAFQVDQDNEALGDNVQKALDTLLNIIRAIELSEELELEVLMGMIKQLQNEVRSLDEGLEQEKYYRVEGDANLQNQINSLEQEENNLEELLAQETKDRIAGDQFLQDEIDALETSLSAEVTDRQDGDTALGVRIDNLATDDLVDVNSANAKLDQFLIHNGSQWVAEDFHIDTELTYQGGISVVNDTAPSADNGDLYINNEGGTVGASWAGIAGKTITPAVAVGWSTKNARWYMLGDIASAAVVRVEAGAGIDVDDTKPAEPVVSIDRTETDNWYSDFNHDHEGLYLEQEVDPTVPDHVKDISKSDIKRWDDAHGWGDGSDKVSKTDSSNQSIVSNLSSSKNISASKFIGDGSSLTNITTDQLSDVTSASAKQDEFLIFNGAQWEAKPFYLETELTYQGSISCVSDPAPNSSNGDLYINNEAGEVGSSWTGIAGMMIGEAVAVGWAEKRNRWFILGDIASGAVLSVGQGTAITVNDDDPANPVVSVEKAYYDKWNEAHSWGDPSKEIEGLGSRIDNLATNDLIDVSSANAKLDQFLIHDGSKWVAEDFHLDTELTYQGAWNLTAAPPSTKANGDLYINNTNGTVNAGWRGIAGETVREGNVVGWSTSKNRWYLLGDIASSAVTEVKGGTGITVNSTEPAKPIVNLDLATSSDRGGAKIGFTTNTGNRNYAVLLSNERMYVNVPWTDTSNFDNYSHWNVTVNGATTSQIGSKATLDFKGSGNTTVSKSGNTITISSSGGDNGVPDGSKTGQMLSWTNGGWAVDPYITTGSSELKIGGTTLIGFYSLAQFNENVQVNGTMTATTVVKNGGTADQLLCANGSVADKGYSKSETKRNVVMTEAQYNALGSKDAETIYFLT